MPTRWLQSCALALALTALLPTLGQGQSGWSDAQPVPGPEDQAPTEAEAEADSSALATDDVEGETTDSADSGGIALPEGVRRARPTTSAAELDWMRAQREADPFLRALPAIGAAPEVAAFYDPLKSLQLDLKSLEPQACRYLIQDGYGRVVGNLSLVVRREDSPAYGPVWHVSQRGEGPGGDQVELWQSAVTGRPLRVLRSRESGAATVGEGGVLVKNLERLDAQYHFDRVNLSKTRGGVTLAKTARLKQFRLTFDASQVPLLLLLLDFNAADWPVEALLYDSVNAHEGIGLQFNRPKRVDVFTAEPATRQCWEVPVRWGSEQQLWYVDRLSPRLVKFQYAGYTFTLQDAAEL